MTIRWGVIGPGNIARTFATALQSLPDAECYSVVSRAQERAQNFATEFAFKNAHDSLDTFLADPALDAVYIASPHNAHAELCVACIEAGKAVICEKPIAVNTRQAEQIFNLAAGKGVLVIEAVWTRFLPVYQQVREWLDNDQIGDVRLVHATFSISKDFDAQHRLFNPHLAGGSILDLGIYPVTLCDWVFNESPVSIQANGQLGQSGVDEQMVAILEYSDGRFAQIGSGLQVQSQLDAWIIGRRGKINIHAPFWGSEGATLYNTETPENGITITLPHTTNGYVFEAEETNHCLKEGLTESPMMPHRTSLRVLQILDELRSQLGLVYPFEANL